MWGGKTVVYFCKWSFFPRNYQKTYQIVSDFSKLCLIPLVEETVSGINATLLNRFTTSGKGFLLGLMWYLWWRAFTRWFQQDTFCINRTHRAADDVVLVRVPTDISHARVVAHQSGYHRAGQHIVDWTHTHTHTQGSTDFRFFKYYFVHQLTQTLLPFTHWQTHTVTYWRFCPWNSRSRWISAQCWTLVRNGSVSGCGGRHDLGRSLLRCRLSACVS